MLREEDGLPMVEHYATFQSDCWLCFTRTTCRTPCCKNKLNNVFNTSAFLDAGKDSRTVATHLLRVAIHNLKRGRHQRSQIDLRSR